METIRYGLRQNDLNSYWSVIDVFTGQAVVVDGLLVDCLTNEEADYLVDLMNLQDVLHRKGLERD
ncbi:hypothetical protein FHT86_006971 [Rhizobium sp. BK313]|uniref:hypothetical protein n=1 Tax=Rhizobium sp. BK313 TaxID=2587081 RepID=UPI00105F2C6A|nr:hypothetical protein [Rhizobium sp. BK313]MBB3458645.1 hypothetical protein [Rhizobium sp. BK313]